MTGVADDKANVVFGSELQGLGYMDGRGDIDCIFNEISKGAWLGDGVIWVACSIGEERSHERRRGLIAEGSISLCPPHDMHDSKNLLLLR